MAVEKVRDNGTSRTDDDRLDVKLTSPGSPGTGTNPELVAGKKKITLPSNAAIRRGGGPSLD